MAVPEKTIGTAPEALDVPTCSGYTIDGQTFNREDTSAKSKRLNHQSKTVSRNYNDAGHRVTFTWMVNDGSSRKAIGDVVSLTYTGAVTTKYSVEDAKDHPDEAGVWLQDLVLEHDDSMTYP